MIDHAILAPATTPAQVRQGCELAVRLGVACVCVRPSDVAQAVRLLAGSRVGVCTVIGFPHGSTTPAAKLAEAREALAAGASELDMVINIGRLIAGEHGYVRDEIAAIVQAAAGRVVKVILECGCLQRPQMQAACGAALEAGAAFAKTSTGFGPRGATVEDVQFLHEQVRGRAGVKASGGIHTAQQALAMIAAGASRLGLSRTEEILSQLEG